VKLQFSRAALHDLVRLREFIAIHPPVAANRVADRLLRAIKGLVVTPRIGRPVDDFPGEVREFIFGRYVVRYKVIKSMLYILRIWHGRENR
jgi:plasmid stabilization system protein ParE